MEKVRNRQFDTLAVQYDGTNEDEINALIESSDAKVVDSMFEKMTLVIEFKGKGEQRYLDITDFAVQRGYDGGIEILTEEQFNKCYVRTER